VDFGIAMSGEISVSGNKPAEKEARLALPGAGAEEELGVTLAINT
jgi:hypothetical protein